MKRLPAIVLLLLLAAAHAAAQQPSNWSPVRQLTAGAEVRAIVDPGVSHVGAFRSADDDSITVLIDGTDHRLLRAGVRELATAGTSRKKNLWWGLAIGAAASVVAVSLQCRGESSSCNEGAPVLFYPIAGAGVAIGAFMAPQKVWREVYTR